MHTEKCIADTQTAKKAQNYYDWLYPEYCRSCRGQGGTYSSYDPSPDTVALSSGSYADFKYCRACVSKGVCPRCGHATYPVDEDGEPVLEYCTYCCFQVAKDYGRPELPECFCYEREER